MIMYFSRASAMVSTAEFVFVMQNVVPIAGYESRRR